MDHSTAGDMNVSWCCSRTQSSMAYSCTSAVLLDGWAVQMLLFVAGIHQVDWASWWQSFLSLTDMSPVCWEQATACSGICSFP